jgi:L,D-transpeptidase YcbB
MILRRRPVFRVSLVILFSIALGCPSQSMPATPDAEAIAQQLRTIANAGILAGLKYPNFPDYRQHVQVLYEAVGYMPVWVRDGQPTPQAQAVITAFGVSRLKGLNP